MWSLNFLLRGDLNSTMPTSLHIDQTHHISRVCAKSAHYFLFACLSPCFALNCRRGTIPPSSDNKLIVRETVGCNIQYSRKLSRVLIFTVFADRHASTKTNLYENVCACTCKVIGYGLGIHKDKTAKTF